MKILDLIKTSNFFHSLRVQLILFFTVFSLIVLSVGSYLSYSFILNIMTKQNEKLILQQFKQSEFNIKSVINDVDRLSKLFIMDDNIQDFLILNYFTPELDVVEMQQFIVKRINDFINNYNYINSIYIYTENGGGIGGNERNTFVANGDEKVIGFFTSDMYKAAKSYFPKIILGGGRNETYFNEMIAGSKTYVISIARGIKPISEPSRNATLVFNLNERYIASTYAAASNFKDGLMYIVDSSGKIISSSDGKNIGSSNELFIGLTTGKDYGSSTVNRINQTLQVVYYKIKDTDWYIVEELPLTVFSEDVLAIQKIILFVFAASILIISAVSILWMRKITEPLNILDNNMYIMGTGKLGLTIKKIPKNELGRIIKRFNEMSLNVVDLLKKNEEMQEMKRELEIEALQSQINPHFIFNTLNMIRWMAAVSKSKNIYESIVALGNILKPIFKNNSALCSLQDEIEYLENYIKIMNWRFGNGISFSFNIPENVLSCKILRFILQPLIENSISHGMKKDESVIEINISVIEEDGDLQIIIRDNGKGISEEMLKEIRSKLENTGDMPRNSPAGSIGIYNVNRRICLNYGSAFGINIESREDEGTKVVVLVPGLH